MLVPLIRPENEGLDVALKHVIWVRVMDSPDSCSAAPLTNSQKD